MLLGLGFRPRSGELLECGRFSARPELHREHTGNGAIPEPAGGQVAEQSHDTLELFRVPTIVEAVARSEPHWRIFLADDLRRDACGLTDLAGREIAADTGQHDRFSIGVLRRLHLPVRGLGHDPVRDLALRTEAANLLEVHVIHLFKEPRLFAFRELRQEVPDPPHFTQFSTFRAGTRLNSATLSVTHTASIARACAAISMSCAPIGVPFLSRVTRMDA